MFAPSDDGSFLNKATGRDRKIVNAAVSSIHVLFARQSPVCALLCLSFRSVLYSERLNRSDGVRRASDTCNILFVGRKMLLEL